MSIFEPTEILEFLQDEALDCLPIDFGMGQVVLPADVSGGIKDLLTNYYKEQALTANGVEVHDTKESSLFPRSFVPSGKAFPENSAGMVDWFRGEVSFLHDPLPAGTVLSISPDGEVEWEIVKSIQARGSHESSLKVRSAGGNGLGQATSLLIDGNLCKFLQGHNIVGSLDLNFLVLNAFKVIVEEYGDYFGVSSAPDIAYQKIKNGDYLVKMIDINFLYDVKNDASVESWLHAAEMNARTRTGRALRDKGTVYIQKHSRRWAIKFYNKFREVNSKSKGHRLNDAFRGTGLDDFVEGKLRAELRLMPLELKDLQIFKGSDLTQERLIELYNKYMSKIEMKNNATLLDSELLELPKTVHSSYQLWRQGANLRELLSRTTFFRHKKLLLEYSIDIDFPPSNPEINNVIPLLRVIEASPVQVPQDFYTQGLVAC